MVLIFPFNHTLHVGGGCGLEYHYNDDVNDFYSVLTTGLQDLERSIGPDFFTFEWVRQAVDFVRSVHSGVLILVEKLKLPVSSKGEEWLNEYMDETVKLLDVCNVLKSGLGSLEHYQMLVSIVVGALDGNGNMRNQCYRGMHAVNACKQAMDRMEAEHKHLIEAKIEVEGKLCMSMTDKHVDNKFLRWNGFWGVMFAVKNTISFLCQMLLWALVYAGSNPAFNFETVSFKAPWSAALLSLQQHVNEEISRMRNSKRSAVILSHDLETLKTCLADLRSHLQPLMRGSGWRNEDMDAVRQVVQHLKQQSTKFQSGLETIEWHINDLFDEIIDGRKKLLNIFSNATC